MSHHSVHPAAHLRPTPSDHLAIGDGRGAQGPVAGQLWLSAGCVWRVVDVDLTRLDPYERVVLEIHKSSQQRDMEIAGILEKERGQQLVTKSFVYPPLTASSFDRMTVEPKWFEQPSRKLVGEAA